MEGPLQSAAKLRVDILLDHAKYHHLPFLRDLFLALLLLADLLEVLANRCRCLFRFQAFCLGTAVLTTNSRLGKLYACG